MAFGTELGLPPALLEWIAASVGPGARVLAVQPQGGATSSTLSRVEVLYHDRRLPLVLRQFTNRDWLAEEPDVPGHEAAALLKAAEAGVPAPRVLAWDSDGSHTGIPALLMTCLPGRVDLHPADFDAWLLQMAEALLPIHAVDARAFPYRYHCYNDVTRLEVPSWSRVPGLWQRAIQIVNTPPPPTTEVFIHRDYHPVNVLFVDGRLSGVVDWANACRGPLGFDASWCRINLAFLFGPEAAARFLQAYRTVTGGQGGDDVYWDLMACVEVLPGPPQVYPPWVEYGYPSLTDAMMCARIDTYLETLVG